MIKRATTLSALALAGVLGVVALPAEASTAYRYWSYWNAETSSTQWQYSTEGSGTRIPADGAVEGWRFGIAGDAARIQPSVLPDFASICAGVEAPQDGKRVALVIDPGTSEEAPEGQLPGAVITECVTTTPSSTGLQILQAVVDVRMDAGFVCGLDGYPARECAPLVEMPAPAPRDGGVSVTSLGESRQSTESTQEATTSTGTPLATAAALSIAALIGFGIWRRRRRVHT